jgi:Antibiotic biosynthesis monooxygenase
MKGESQYARNEAAMRMQQDTTCGATGIPDVQMESETPAINGPVDVMAERGQPKTCSDPAMIVASYRLRPHQRTSWIETWRSLELIARSIPECHTFELDLDSYDSDRCTVISTWSSGAAFDRFVRDVGLLWIERALGYSCSPPQYTRLRLPCHEQKSLVGSRHARAREESRFKAPS